MTSMTSLPPATLDPAAALRAQFPGLLRLLGEPAFARQTHVATIDGGAGLSLRVYRMHHGPS